MYLSAQSFLWRFLSGDDPNELMKNIGIAFLVIGGIALMVGLNLDTTVASGIEGGRVHNIGLMNDRQTIVVIAGVIAIVGAIFVGFSSRNNVTRVNPMTAENRTRQCPFCAEHVKYEALVCRYCQRDLPSSDSSVAAAKLAARSALVPPANDGSESTANLSQRGTCPECFALVSVDSSTCPRCKLIFGPETGKSLKPFP